MIVLQYDLDKFDLDEIKSIFDLVSNATEDKVLAIPRDIGILWDVDTTFLTYLKEQIDAELNRRYTEEHLEKLIDNMVVTLDG